MKPTVIVVGTGTAIGIEGLATGVMEVATMRGCETTVEVDAMTITMTVMIMTAIGVRGTTTTRTITMTTATVVSVEITMGSMPTTAVGAGQSTELAAGAQDVTIMARRREEGW